VNSVEFLIQALKDGFPKNNLTYHFRIKIKNQYFSQYTYSTFLSMALTLALAIFDPPPLPAPNAPIPD
jgi:hypothetical protein